MPVLYEDNIKLLSNLKDNDLGNINDNISNKNNK